MTGHSQKATEMCNVKNRKDDDDDTLAIEC